MSATLAKYAGANTSQFLRNLKRAENARMVRPLNPNGLYYFDTGNITVPVASRNEADDEYFLIGFPENSYLVDLFVNGTDIGDNNCELKVVSGPAATIGTGLTDLIAAARVDAATWTMLGPDAAYSYHDIGGDYLGIKITTAPIVATATTTTVRMRGLVYVGTAISTS